MAALMHDMDKGKVETSLKGLTGVSNVQFPGGDRVDSKYFVLDYVHDPYAIPALEAYAQACYEDFPNLSAEIRALVQQTKNAK